VQSFDGFAFSAARRQDLTEPLRFAAQRFGELLDPNAHFAASASFTLDPVTALGEFIELARAHAASNGRNPSHHVMLDGVERTRAALVQDPHLSGWYGSRHRAAVAALDLAVDWTAAAAARVGKPAWLIAETSAAARGAVRALWSVLRDPTSGYRCRLAREICSVCREPSLTTADWLKFDEELCLMAAVALAEGRTGSRLARLIGRAIARARDSVSASSRLLQVLEASAEPFVVAFVLEGVGLPRNVAAFDVRYVRPDDPRWKPGANLAADLALSSLCSANVSKTILATAVMAFDFEQAANLAWQRGERLADQYGAQHRAYRIEVTGPLLVLRESDEMISEQTPVPRRVHTAKTRLPRPDSRLEQSLRYAALARAERAPVVQVLHAWIALETLARGLGAPAGPYPFLMQNLAPALAVQAVRQSLAATWHIASRAGRRGTERARWLQVERWLGVRGQDRNLSDLNKWVDLLRHEPAPETRTPTALRDDASLDEAGAVLVELLPTLVPFAREAILRWRWRLAVGNRLSNWCDEVHGQARAALGRMYVMRNSTVHTALTQSSGGDQLAHAARNVVDAVYEVLPPWLVTNEPTWRAFSRLLRRANHVHRTWNHLARPALLNAENLTRPGGDGLAR
jgi:hypothetical protein